APVQRQIEHFLISFRVLHAPVTVARDAGPTCTPQSRRPGLTPEAGQLKAASLAIGAYPALALLGARASTITPLVRAARRGMPWRLSMLCIMPALAGHAEDIPRKI